MMTRYRAMRFSLLASTSLLAVTVGAPPTLEALGAALFSAGVELGAITERGKPAPKEIPA